MVVRRSRKILPDAGRSAPVRTPGTKHGSDVGNGSIGNGLCGNDNGSVRGGAIMYYVKGCKTKEEAKKYEKKNGGCTFSRKDKEYQFAAQAVNLDTKKYPYIVRVIV